LIDSFPTQNFSDLVEAIDMSNGETTTLPGGDSAITLSPGDQTNIYQHQGRYIVASIQMAPNVDIPPGATIDFTKGNSQNSAGFLVLPGEPDPTAVPIVVNPVDKTKGEARLGIRYDTTNTSNTITMYAQASGKWSPVQPPAAAGPVGYKIVTADPTVTIKSPNNALLTIPDHGQDQLAPQGNDVSTAHFSCTVVDDKGNPIPDFIVEWHESGAVSVGLFSYQVNAYTSLTGNFGDALTHGIQGGLVRDSASGGYYVRMVTGASGVADLYMVAKASPGMYVSAVVPQFDYSELTPVPFPFLVWNPDLTTLPHQAPSIAGETGWSSDSSNVGSLKFKDMPESPIVRATVPRYDHCSSSDKIYLVCNKLIVAGPFSPPDPIDSWASWVARFIDTYCYSDTGPNAGKTNDVFFVVAKDGGGLDTSAHNLFLGTGNTLQSTIPTGPLLVPTFNPAVGKINNQLVSSGRPLGIDIDLTSQPTYAGWTPQEGDRLTATAYMSGWKEHGYVEAVGSATATPYTLLQGDPSKTVTLWFPSTDPFKDWDSNANTYGNSVCLIVYAVHPNGAPSYRVLYSEILGLILNTANES
jgi:hypothetical protein